MKQHHYQTKVQWTGNTGQGTKSYQSYHRNHQIFALNKYDLINGSADPEFLGDKTKYNPEELFLSSISACHMLWYLHLCSANKIVVTEYIDNAVGIMQESDNGSGKFTKVTLYPQVKITDKNNIDKAKHLHNEAHKMCFIANSCNFEIACQANIIT